LSYFQKHLIGGIFQHLDELKKKAKQRGGGRGRKRKKVKVSEIK
jgi:hypothetical protein